MWILRLPHSGYMIRYVAFRLHPVHGYISMMATPVPRISNCGALRCTMPASSEPIGTMTLVGEHVLLQCGDGHLRLLEVQPEGKRRMDAAAFFRGLRGNGPFHLA